MLYHDFRAQNKIRNSSSECLGTGKIKNMVLTTEVLARLLFQIKGTYAALQTTDVTVPLPILTKKKKTLLVSNGRTLRF